MMLGQPPTEWAQPMPELPPGCPKGLELLLGLDALFVRQSVEAWEMIAGFEQANRYEVLSVHGQRLYLALEMADRGQLMCGGSSRAFEMALVDSGHVEQLHISRPYVCCGGDMVTVTVGGVVVGTVQQEGTLSWNNLALCDASGAKILTIESHFLVMDIENEFVLKGADGVTPIGRVAKQWSGFFNELLTDADNFGVNFPVDLDVKMKATVLAATFLIDFIFFEKTPNRPGHGFSSTAF